MVTTDVQAKFAPTTEVIQYRPVPVRGFVLTTTRRLNGTVIVLVDTPEGNLYVCLERNLEEVKHVSENKAGREKLTA